VLVVNAAWIAHRERHAAQSGAIAPNRQRCLFCYRSVVDGFACGFERSKVWRVATERGWIEMVRPPRRLKLILARIDARAAFLWSELGIKPRP